MWHSEEWLLHSEDGTAESSSVKGSGQRQDQNRVLVPATDALSRRSGRVPPRLVAE